MTAPTGMTSTTNRMTDHVGHVDHNGHHGHVGHMDRDVRHVHRGDETKPSWKTTELAIYVLSVLGVLIASASVGDSGGSAGDIFAADKAWWYITLLTIGYMVSRGLAKAGSRTRDNDPRTSR
ncbi:hypothetical protein [Micromonospora inyonensis]|uniref:Uncharacterized protein n=1 Tax=Micromonospora inyonensis TaxID=47866 RepID=A0A1C6R8T4_9ACTN|nr:hypothetical protein [Micromonospora inyonensis]SCL13490.1 hypothetical protein GA0074694_0360 [Micromonospora inyonensis]